MEVFSVPQMSLSSSTCFSTLNFVPWTPVPALADSGPKWVHFS